MARAAVLFKLGCAAACCAMQCYAVICCCTAKHIVLVGSVNAALQHNNIISHCRRLHLPAGKMRLCSAQSSVLPWPTVSSTCCKVPWEGLLQLGGTTLLSELPSSRRLPRAWHALLMLTQLELSLPGWSGQRNKRSIGKWSQ